MPLPADTEPPTVALRRAVAAIALILVVAIVASGCSDDGRPTGATHRLIIEPCAGRLDQRATGTAIAPEVVATVAHSLEGVRGIQMRGGDGRTQSAEVVYLDQDRDIALLRPERPIADHLDLVSPDGPGPVGVIRYDDRSANPRIDEGEILELVTITLDGEGRRAAARLGAAIEPGDSGAAVVDDDGDMVAMVFATARGRDVGWAVSSTELQDALDDVRAGRPGDEPPAC